MIKVLTGADQLAEQVLNKQLIGAICAPENAMNKYLTGTDQSVGRC